MATRKMEIIDTHCHVESWFFDRPDKQPDPEWFKGLFS